MVEHIHRNWDTGKRARHTFPSEGWINWGSLPDEEVDGKNRVDEPVGAALLKSHERRRRGIRQQIRTSFEQEWPKHARGVHVHLLANLEDPRARPAGVQRAEKAILGAREVIRSFVLLGLSQTIEVDTELRALLFGANCLLDGAEQTDEVVRRMRADPTFTRTGETYRELEAEALRRVERLRARLRSVLRREGYQGEGVLLVDETLESLESYRERVIEAKVAAGIDEDKERR
jgi:hypothetical protein